jgi:hypothetical protein
MNNRTSTDSAWQAFRRIYWTLAGAMAIVLVLLAVLGFGPGGRNCKALAATASADASAAVAVAQQPAGRFACRWVGSTSRPSA